VANIPEDISDQEVIVRGVCSPYHIKDDKIKAALYDPTPDTDEISVMRHNHMSSDACKTKAKELENPVQKKIYKGLAVLSVAQIRSTHCDIKDSRNVYFGHADIKVGFIVPRGEPLPAEQMQLLRDRKKMLVKLTNYFPDPEPPAIKWTGEELVPKIEISGT
jgi:hypothetical protein